MSQITGIPADTLRERERTSTTKRLRRIGRWCHEDFRRAVALNRPNKIALTFCDYLDARNAEAKSVEQLHGIDEMYLSAHQENLAIWMASTGFGERFVLE